MNSKKFVVFGNPIAHSRSPQIHQEFAKICGFAIDYQRILLPLDGVAEGIERFIAAGGSGANVTLPFKEEVFQYVQAKNANITAAAQLAGAVNTLSFLDQQLVADNTDGRGLIFDLKNNLQWELAGKRILLIGAGGAAKGIFAPLLAEQPEYLLLVNRSLLRAEQLYAQMSANFPNVYAKNKSVLGNVRVCALADLVSISAPSFDLIINATSSSLQQEKFIINQQLISEQSLAYDLMYQAGGSTSFLRQMGELGVTRLADGWGMLVEQAAEAFALWHGVRPETRPVIELLRP